MSKVEYTSNNSGGSWRLTDQNWLDLEKAGWVVEWNRDRAAKGDWFHVDADGRFLGALATSATREGLSMKQAIAEWEDITGQNSAELGCYSCCGAPHSFSDDSGNSYSPGAPEVGSRYEGN
jgi:hypothetical protein